MNRVTTSYFGMIRDLSFNLKIILKDFLFFEEMREKGAIF